MTAQAYRVDFHMHTALSDGACAPEQVYAMIADAGLSHWAITDHDCTEGAETYAHRPGAVIGCEVTAWEEGREVHVVALGIDPGNEPFKQFLHDIRVARDHRLQELVTYLGERHGLELNPDAGKRDGSRIASRSHLAGHLLDQGLVAHPAEAFKRWLGDAQVAELAAPQYPSLAATGAAIRAAGGLAILAHPALYQDYSMVERLLAPGHCDGCETSHPRCDRAWQHFLRSCCTRFHLLESCGSDFHFPGRRQIGDCTHDQATIKPLLERLGCTA